MKHRLYPTLEELKAQNTPLTNGVWALIHFLDAHLPYDRNWKKGDSLTYYKGWLIFVQPFLSGARPDIIIFHPYVGVVIYEVEDKDLSYYNNDTIETLYIHEEGAKNLKKSPIKQVSYYKDKLIAQLIPSIGEESDKKRENYGLVKTAVYFHNASTSNAQSMFGKEINDKFKAFPIFGSDLLTYAELPTIVPGVNFSTNKYWDSSWNKEILFFLKPPYHSMEQGRYIKLTADQKKVARPKKGHYRVKGVAGSGKTLALAYRAALLASEQKNVLIISFNITLWHYIKSVVGQIQVAFSWEYITFNHFHGFCKDELNNFGVRWPLSSKQGKNALKFFFKEDVPRAVEQAIKSKNKGVKKYDAILIDEGQDYEIEWYKLLTTYYLTSHDEVVVVSDKKQNIYNRALDWLDKRGANKHDLSKFKTSAIRLDTSYRLPAKIVDLTNDFSLKFGLNQELKTKKNNEYKKIFATNHIVWLNIEDNEWEDYIVYAFRRLKKEGFSVADMVILLPDHQKGRRAVEIFSEMKLDVNHVFRNNDCKGHKKAFWMEDGRLKMSTIHSFKGWELLNIVMFIPEYHSEGIENLDSIVYTAMTRAKQNLIIINSSSRYWDFGEDFPKTWHGQI